jgi:hypothetical protein
MPDPEIYEDGPSPRLLSDHDIAKIMTVLKMLGESWHDPEKIQFEYSQCYDWLEEHRHQPEK